MTMRLAAVAIAAALTWSACSTAEPARPVRIELGKSFSLKAGASAATDDAALQIGFEAVTSDSRCPKGEQCVRAGEATVRLWLQQGAGPKQARELTTAPGPAQALRLPAHELRLLRLDPVAVTGKPIAAADYVATLTLTRAPSADPDR